MRLTPQSIAFLKNSSPSDGTPQELPTWKLNYARLFCELYEIIRSAHESLNDLSLGKWSIVYSGEDHDQALSFSFKLNIEAISDRSNVIIRIEPHGSSSIEVSNVDGPETSPLMNEQLKSFYLSPAYRRYFAPHASDTVAGIRAVIPKKQITSRYFGEYLIHLLQMMRPYLVATSRSRAKAA